MKNLSDLEEDFLTLRKFNKPNTNLIIHYKKIFLNSKHNLSAKISFD